jgi:hypothetical protein
MTFPASFKPVQEPPLNDRGCDLQAYLEGPLRIWIAQVMRGNVPSTDIWNMEPP